MMVNRVSDKIPEFTFFPHITSPEDVRKHYRRLQLMLGCVISVSNLLNHATLHEAEPITPFSTVQRVTGYQGLFSPFFPFPSAGNCMNGKELIRDDRNHLLCSRSNKLFPTFQNFYFLKIYSEKENYTEKKTKYHSNFEC